MNILANELARQFEQVQPMDFYREIFPDGELAPYMDNPAEEDDFHSYTGILVRFNNLSHDKSKRPDVQRVTVTDDLDEVDAAINTNQFCIMSPISYIGKSRKSTNARFMYALCIEVDNLVVKRGRQQGLKDLLHQCDSEAQKGKPVFPRPTFIVASGNGLHLYYVFERPVPMYKNVVKELTACKRELTRKIWNRYVTTDHEEEKVQYESIFQGFRMVGTVTKAGDRVEAFRVGERVTLEDLNACVSKKAQVSVAYKSPLCLAEAKQKYPEWYERRIVNGEKKGRWTCNRALYEWWRDRIENEAVVGKRYFCLMMLSIYAIKCDISQEELEKDALAMREIFDEKTTEESNHFTEKDVADALQSFEDRGLVTYPINSIVYRSGIPIEKNKRNHRKQSTHLKMARSNLAILSEDSGHALQGRHTAEKIVREWRIENPEGKKADCIRETGLTKPTVYKWWEA